MTNSDEITELIKTLAAKHSITVGRDDPILILHTMNDLLMTQAADRQAEIVRTFAEQIEMVSDRWSTDAKNKAEKVLNVALTASKDAMKKQLDDSSGEIIKLLRRDINKEYKKILKSNRITSIINMLTSILILLVGSITVYMIK